MSPFSMLCSPTVRPFVFEMLSSHLDMSVPYKPMNRVPIIFLSPLFGYAAEQRFQSSGMQSDCRVSPPLVIISSFKGLQCCRALNWRINTEEASHVSEFGKQLSSNYHKGETLAKEIQLDSFEVEESLDGQDQKESQRRRKIGLANKGRVPWNKGRKHTAETRERIRQRTKEALRDPKVRKKMSECPRTLSNQTKARIRTSLRRLWEERLKWKRSREKFILSWAESIANAAKKGGLDQQELDWDSYDKMKREFDLQQLQWAADKAKAREMAQIRSERLAQAKAEKTAKLALKRKEAEHKAKVSGEVKRKVHKKTKEEKEELAVAQELKLKERLTKIHRKKTLNGQVTSQDHRAWERLDMEFIKREPRRKEVSLADQISNVKNKKTEFLVKGTLATLSSIYPSSDTSSVE